MSFASGLLRGEKNGKGIGIILPAAVKLAMRRDAPVQSNIDLVISKALFVMGFTSITASHIISTSLLNDIPEG